MHLLIRAACLITLLCHAAAFQLVIDSNTMSPADLQHASQGTLSANGSYSIFVNTHNASDELWRAYMKGVGGGLRFTEDNPGSYASCAEFKRITGHAPTAALGYHETGETPGGTVLTDSEIDAQAAACDAPVIVLTRAFCHTDKNLHCIGDPSVPAPDSPWVANTTRALQNKNVFGVAIEYTPLRDCYQADKQCMAAKIQPPYSTWGTCNCQGCNAAGMMHNALGMNKSVLLLWPLYAHNQNKTAWQNVADAVQGLRTQGAPMESDKVIVVLARYNTQPPHGPVEWWGKDGNTVQHAYDWLQGARTDSPHSH